MKKRAVYLSKWLWGNLVGKKRTQSLIQLLSKLGDINLALFVYNQMGILKSENSYVSGELYVIQNVLKEKINKPFPIFFDVGANRGDYSKDLFASIPHAIIFAFEPNPYTYKILYANLQSQHIRCYCLGFSSNTEQKTIYTYSNSLNSAHASLYKNVFSDIHKAKDIAGIEIQLTTLDEFCVENQIEQIDFLKIDTEGHELDVLNGAKRLLKEHRISIIQFEFNEMNVISRSFLKDFYTLLNDYDIYRLDTQQLIPLPNYDTFYEIFKYQNLLAITKTLSIK